MAPTREDEFNDAADGHRGGDFDQLGSQGAILPKLDAEQIDGKKTVLTIRSARKVNLKDGTGAFLAIVFEEFPEHEYVTNATQEDALLGLVEAGILPNRLGEWGGRRVAFYKKNNLYLGKTYTKLYAFDAEDHAEAIASYDQAKAAGRSAATGKVAGRK